MHISFFKVTYISYLTMCSRKLVILILDPYLVLTGVGSDSGGVKRRCSLRDPYEEIILGLCYYVFFLLNIYIELNWKDRIYILQLQSGLRIRIRVFWSDPDPDLI